VGLRRGGGLHIHDGKEGESEVEVESEKKHRFESGRKGQSNRTWITRDEPGRSINGKSRRGVWLEKVGGSRKTAGLLYLNTKGG